ncbi:hypothetical protein, partial [Klebsiella pneumoniae]|uniref:hypothetical protein n=1 Tax=Klebsiella pneumoniae TaxID=573 RepID=UPI00351DED3D
ANVQGLHNSYNRDKEGRLSTPNHTDSHTKFGVPYFIASNYVCDRVLKWYEGNKNEPLNGDIRLFKKKTTLTYASLGTKSV